MPALVKDGCARILKSVKDNLVLWIGVGKTTPWEDEDNPPAESLDATTITDIQGLKKVDIVQFVVEDPTGEVIFKNKRYRRVDDTGIYLNDARWLYVGAWLIFDEFPVVDFRQTALFTDVIPTSGNENREILLPSQVQSYGVMLAYVNHHVRHRVSYGKDLVEMVIELEGQVTSL